MRKPENPVCDFCNKPTPDDHGTRTHLAKPFVLTVMVQGAIVPINFTEEWLACPECDQLIRAGKKGDLLARALEGAPSDPASVIIIQELFWKNKKD
jgi:hypothetical protein